MYRHREGGHDASGDRFVPGELQCQFADKLDGDIHDGQLLSANGDGQLRGGNGSLHACVGIVVPGWNDDGGVHGYGRGE
jgi:hypothetical protein